MGFFAGWKNTRYVLWQIVDIMTYTFGGEWSLANRQVLKPHCNWLGCQDCRRQQPSRDHSNPQLHTSRHVYAKNLFYRRAVQFMAMYDMEDAVQKAEEFLEKRQDTMVLESSSLKDGIWYIVFDVGFLSQHLKEIKVNASSGKIIEYTSINADDKDDE